MVTFYSMAVTILGILHCINVDMLGGWLCKRQLPSLGLNGNILQYGCYNTGKITQCKHRHARLVVVSETAALRGIKW